MSLLDSITHDLEHIFELQRHIQQQQLQDNLTALQTWQSKRLRLTYDFLYQKDKFVPAIEFFLEELYGPRQYSQRDEDLHKIIPKMAKLLPDKAMLSLAKAMELNRLSLHMDIKMLAFIHDMPITKTSYAHAYRKCDNQDEREKQIDFIEELSQDLNKVTKIRGISILLKMSRTPAEVAGFLSLHQFLEKGYKAFKNIGDIKYFIGPIVNQERLICEALFAGKMPFPEEIL